MATNTNKRGRPLIINESVLHKLEEVFALGGTDLEACLYAGISKSALYNYQQVNPDFVERKELLKENPVLLARRTIVKELKTDALTARWYVERRDKSFNLKQELDLTTKGDKLSGNEDALKAAAILYGDLIAERKKNEQPSE